MNKREAIAYIRGCGENDGPETIEEAREIFAAMLGCEPDSDMSHFDLWSSACAAYAARTGDAWWAWHDADASRWSPGEDADAATRDAEARCAAWIAGDSTDGPED